MAESMTYSSLVEDIQTYAERDDQPFVDQIPRFIMLCENRIASEIRGLGYVRFVTGALTSGDPKLQKPDRWRETLDLNLTLSAGQRVFLFQRSYEYLRVYAPNPTTTAQPKYYSDYGYDHYFFAPTPDDAYSIEIGYHERPVPLDDSNQTNWTTQYAPQLLLYGSLLEAQPFLKRQERIAEFQALFTQAAQAVMTEANRRVTGDQNYERSIG